jgi:iron complex outermembrane receptor protein
MKSNSTGHLGRLLALAGALLGSFAPLWSAAADTQAESPDRLDEIVVTARKRAENVQDVPISISAFSGDQLEKLGVQDLADVAHFSPNLQFDRTAAVSGSSIASTIFIRGIGQTDFTLNSDPGVGVYLDGVYIARSVGSLLDLIDIQTVEVLRGPQGTLFGKNTIGGALNITSRQPSTTAGGYIEAQAGNFARRNIKAQFDAPVSATFRTSLSFATLNEEGYQHRVLQPDAPDLGDVDRIVVRGRALWTPVEAFSADVVVDYSRGREQSVPQSVLVIVPTINSPFLTAAAGVPNGTTPTLRPGFAGQFSGNDILNGRFISTDPRRTFYAGSSRSNFDIFGASSTLAYDFGAGSLKSISAYRRIGSQFARDSLSSPFVVADTFDDYAQDQWSQELQFAGDWPGGLGDYVAGAFYLKEKGTNSNLVDTSIGGLGSGGSVDNESVAVFAQTNLHFTEQLGATIGARYTREEKGFTPGFRGGSQVFTSNANGLAITLPPTVPLIQDGHYTDRSNKVDITASLQWRLRAGLLSYVSYSTGFKAGGFSQRVGPGPGNPIPAPSFRPEEVKVAELGVKWLGLDGRLRLNGDVFHTDYDDVQITPLFEGIGPVTRNAGKARVQGAELEWAFVPSKWWDVSGGLGLLDTEYRSLTAQSQVNRNLDGTAVLTLDSELAKSPDISANLVLAGHWPAGNGGRFSASVDWSYTSELFNDVLNSAELRRPALSLLGAAISLVSADGHWDLTLRGVNLTDEEYIIAGNAERYDANIGYTQATYARPREWWISVRRDF